MTPTLTEVTFQDLRPTPRAAILASCLTRAGNPDNPTEWGTLLTLEDTAHDALSNESRRAFWELDVFLTSLARVASTGLHDGDRRSAARRLLAVA